MKLLILSDSHGSTKELEMILQKERSSDMIIHLGDGGSDLLQMNEYTQGKPVYQIKGNCDLSVYNFPLRLISYVRDIKFFACHGHAYNVKSGVIPLFYTAKEEGCTIALFGHTHCPYYEEYDGVHLFNPGSARDGSYGILDIGDNGFSFIHRNIFPE